MFLRPEVVGVAPAAPVSELLTGLGSHVVEPAPSGGVTRTRFGLRATHH